MSIDMIVFTRTPNHSVSESFTFDNSLRKLFAWDKTFGYFPVHTNFLLFQPNLILSTNFEFS